MRHEMHEQAAVFWDGTVYHADVAGSEERGIDLFPEEALAEAENGAEGPVAVMMRMRASVERANAAVMGAP